MNHRKKKRLIRAGGLALCLCMLLTYFPVAAFALTEDGLCEHHPEHTEECGYVAAVEGQPCTHEHTDDCYSIIQCIHEHNEDCRENCTHVCSEENGCITVKHNCHHSHDENCGYSEGVPAFACTHECGEECAEGCIHEHDDTCGYAEEVESTPCNHSCSIEDDCYELVCSHAIAGQHDDTCGYVEGKTGRPCGFVCDECAAVPKEEPNQESDVGNPVADTESDVESKWGASIDSLTESGTLEDALAAASEADSTVKYIQIQKSITGKSGLKINGGEFTIDLGGYTLNGSNGSVIYIRNSEAVVTFTDSGSAGKLISTYTYGAVKVEKGKAIFTGGSYEGPNAVWIDSGGVAEITGGTFAATNNRAVYNNGQLTISGGTFIGGGNPYFSGVVCTDSSSTTTITGGIYRAYPNENKDDVEYLTNIQYYGGVLNLQNYNGATPLTDLTISNFVNTFSVTDNIIQLPNGYEFYLNDDVEQATVTELEKDKTYGIKYTGSEPEIASVSITWGAMNFTYSDGTWNTETYVYDGEGWTAEGNTVTVENTGNVAVTATVSYQNETNYSFTASWDKKTASIPQAQSETFTLTLSGKPDETLDKKKVGTVTVTIQQADQTT